MHLDGPGNISNTEDHTLSQGKVPVFALVSYIEEAHLPFASKPIILLLFWVCVVSSSAPELSESRQK